MDFESWWESHGQYGRAGGGDYEKTFAFNAWTFAIQSLMSILKEGGQAPEGRIAMSSSGEGGQVEAPLLHCPFCGPGQSRVDLWFDEGCQRYRVGCGRCGCSTGTHPRDKTPAPAVLAWNTRKDRG